MSTTEDSVENQTAQAAERLEYAICKWLATHREPLRQWRNRAAGRRRLREMTAGELADIGIDRVDALQEAAEPFWKQ